MLTRRRITTSVLIIVAVAVATLFVEALYGVLPGLSGNLQAYYHLMGRINCGALSFDSLLQSTCPVVGGDAGGLFQNNIPGVIVSSVLVRFGLSAVWAYAIVAFVVVGAGLTATHLLVRKAGVNRVIAYFASVAFFASTSMLGIVSFGGMTFGISLLTVSALLGWLFLDAMRAGAPRRRGAVLGVALVLANTLVVFSDGYSYLMLGVFLGLSVVIWAVKRLRQGRTWLALATVVASLAIPYVLYRTLAQGGDWAKSSIDLFRAMGLDLSTLFLPSTQIWWSKLTGNTVPSNILWGDGSNSSSNYLGFGVLALAVIAVVVTIRKTRNLLVIILLAVAITALVLSLGPSLKWFAVRGELVSPVTYESYLMPSSAALFDLPTGLLYEHVPGFEYMRATYRWFLLARLAFIALAALGLQAIASRWRVRAAIVGVVALLEITVNVPGVISANAARASQAEQFEQTTVVPLDDDLQTGERVLFFPNTSGDNDILANYLVPTMNVWAYNVGGDKALQRAKPLWPEDVQALMKSDVTPEQMLDLSEQILASGAVEVIVVPYFDMRWSSYGWPAAPEYVERGEAAADVYAADDAFVVTESDTYALVTLAD